MNQESLVYGVHAVREFIARHPGRVRQLWALEGRHDARMEEVLRLAGVAGVEVLDASREVLDRLAGGGRHQGLVAHVAAAEALDESALADLLDGLDGPPLLLVLDGVQDPHNLGACLRTADAAGAHAVVIPKDRAAGLTPAARKAAAGAAETVPLVRVVNLARCLRSLKARGLWLVGADEGGSLSLFDAELAGPLALVLGAEGSGLRRLTRETCDLLVNLPMCGSVPSLNVSVAAGILLYQALGQRQGTRGQRPAGTAAP